MKSSKEIVFQILGTPIGDFVICAKYASQKLAKAQELLHIMEDVGSVGGTASPLSVWQLLYDGTSCLFYTSPLSYG